MAEFPALPIFTDSYLADTRHLTAEEHGAYLLLLMCAWRTRGCQLKDDDRFLARTVGVSAQKWRRMRAALADFFTIEGGVWRQKKLTEVYRGVETRVARNRANGAKGGRAKAAKQAGDRQPTATPKPVATKTRIQNPESLKQESGDEEVAVPMADLERIAAAAGLDILKLDGSACLAWLETGADLEADILPTIRRVRARQEKRTGKSPASLAYYNAAVFEARDTRLKARRTGRDHAAAFPAAPARRPFDPSSLKDWREFLGQPSSRFRGDYLARHWHIGADHPLFLSRSLGPDPTARVNGMIPPEIQKEYGPGWGWIPAGGKKGLQKSQKTKKRQDDL